MQRALPTATHYYSTDERRWIWTPEYVEYFLWNQRQEPRAVKVSERRVVVTVNEHRL